MLSKPEIALRWSLGSALVVLFFKGLAYAIGGSAGFFSDAGESLINILTAVLGMYGIWWARQPRDPDHPYGHGKVDALISAIQALIVISTAAVLAILILSGTYKPPNFQSTQTALLCEGLAISINAALAIWLWRWSHRYHSTILRAESLHLIGDIGTSCAVLLSFLALKWGLPPAIDKGMGLIVVGIVGYGALRILRQTGATLVDAQDQHLLQRLAHAIEKHHRPEWIDLHNVRIQRYGTALHIDGHVTLPWYWSLQQAHTSMKELEALIRRELQAEVEFFWHMDPCEPVCCSACKVEGCEYRQSPFQERHVISPKSLFVNQKTALLSSSHQSVKAHISQPTQ
ncbi:MAG: cation diffusion facilitator family transporter [Bacteroidia bacterium]|nr:cation diffusion facilitator family transporter [Bacteroidia bacterium]MDW8015328.1 cation diffusion facilitator family transporter [Bacteroidia bacterium]